MRDRNGFHRTDRRRRHGRRARPRRNRRKAGMYRSGRVRHGFHPARLLIREARRPAAGRSRRAAPSGLVAMAPSRRRSAVLLPACIAVAETRRRAAVGEMGVMTARKVDVVTAGKTYMAATSESYVMTCVRRMTHCGMAEHRGMRRAHRAVGEHRMAGPCKCRMAEAGRVHRPETVAEAAAAEAAVKAAA